MTTAITTTDASSASHSGYPRQGGWFTFVIAFRYAVAMSEQNASPKIASRFRGFLPVVVDVETAGFNPKRDALLEIAAVTLDYDAEHRLPPAHTSACHVEPFPGAHLDEKSLQFTGIDPYHPFRFAKPEAEALREIFQPLRKAVRELLANTPNRQGLLPSCDGGMPPGVSTENLRAFVEAVGE